MPYTFTVVSTAVNTYDVGVDYIAYKHRWNEKIHIACLDEDGEPVENCAWKVPRHHLTPVWLETMCLKCPLQVKVGYSVEIHVYIWYLVRIYRN